MHPCTWCVLFGKCSWSLPVDISLPTNSRRPLISNDLSSVPLAYRPIVVEMAHLVGQPLKVVWLQTRRVTDHIEVSGCDGPLTDTLAHNKKVIPTGGGEGGRRE